MASWPASLPSFDSVSWRHTFKSNLLFNPMEDGRVKRRRKGAVTSRVLEGSLFLEASQVEVFIDFVENDLLDGAVSFDFADFVSAATKSCHLLPLANDELYSISQDGDDLFIVTLKLGMS